MQTQNEDLTTDDQIGTAEGNTEKDLEKQFMHPGYTFKGVALRPYTAGTDLLFNQVLDQNDAPLTVFLSFIFVHIKERSELIPLCWDKNKFRVALLNWIESLGRLTDEDKTEAMKIFEDARGWARKSSIEVLPDPRFPEKKTKAKRQRASRG